jgi:chromosome segregation ATPase
MNNEHIERQMNFIVQQQAQFASDIQKLQESQAQTERVVAQTTKTVAHAAEAVAHTAGVVTHVVEALAQVGDVVTRLATVTHAGFNDLNAKINALIDAQLRTEANVARTEANVARTDESLKDLIAEFDRHRREGRNGK